MGLLGGKRESCAFQGLGESYRPVWDYLSMYTNDFCFNISVVGFSPCSVEIHDLAMRD